jgi:hypothetical protein
MESNRKGVNDLFENQNFMEKMLADKDFMARFAKMQENPSQHSLMMMPPSKADNGKHLIVYLNMSLCYLRP